MSGLVESVAVFLQLALLLPLQICLLVSLSRCFSYLIKVTVSVRVRLFFFFFNCIFKNRLHNSFFLHRHVAHLQIYTTDPIIIWPLDLQLMSKSAWELIGTKHESSVKPRWTFPYSQHRLAYIYIALRNI